MSLSSQVLLVLFITQSVQHTYSSFNCSEYEKTLSDRVEKNMQTFCKVQFENWNEYEINESIVKCNFSSSDAYLKQVRWSINITIYNETSLISNAQPGCKFFQIHDVAMNRTKVKYMEYKYRLKFEVDAETKLLVPFIPAKERDTYLFCFFVENGQLLEISEWFPKLPKNKNETWTPKKTLELTYCVMMDTINTEMIIPGQNSELEFIGLVNGFRDLPLRFGGDMLVCKPQLETLQLEESIIKSFIALSTSPDLNYKYVFNDSIITIYEEFGISQEKLQHVRLLESGSMEIDVHENDFRTLNCSTTFPVLELLLSHNNLEDDSIYLNADLFPCLSHIDLNSNKFTRFPRLFYQHCLPHRKCPSRVVTLKKLNLYSNEISSLSETQHHGVKMGIDTLDLSYNSINNWSDINIFDSEYITIKNLDLSFNDIDIITPVMLMSFSKLNSVDIGGNPFNCYDPWVKNFRTWLDKNSDKVYNEGKSITLEPLCSEYEDSNDVTLSFSLGIGIPLFITVLLLILLGIKYRFQLLYMWHLLKVRRRAKQLRKSVAGQVNNQFRFDAFVSYNHRDRDWVHEQLMHTLEGDEVKYALCLHERDFRLGAYIMDNVAECMETSKHVIIVLSENYTKSKWCQWELQLVQQLLFEKSVDFLILIELQRLSATQIPSTLRLLMSTRTYLEWPGDDGDTQQFWSRLKHVLGIPVQQETSLANVTSSL